MAGRRWSPKSYMARLDYICGLCLCLLAGGCGKPDGQGGEESSGRVVVFVSIQPQAYFVQRIGGERIDVQVLVERGQSPHTCQPTPQQVVKLGEARLLFAIGAEFEGSLLPRLQRSIPSLEVVDCRRGIDLIPMPVTEDDMAAGKGMPDPHIWLDPVRARAIARNVCDALCAIDRQHTEEYTANLKRLDDELVELDREISELLAPLKGGEFYTYHPSFGYFAERYGLRQVAVEAGGREPDARRLKELIDRAKACGVKAILVQPQHSSADGAAIAADIGAALVTVDPLAFDYIDNLMDVADKIAVAVVKVED